MVEFKHIIQDKQGLHARPASQLAETAMKLSSAVTIHTEEKTVDCKKLIAMMKLGAKHLECVRFEVEGENEEADAKIMQEFCEKNL